MSTEEFPEEIKESFKKMTRLQTRAYFAIRDLISGAEEFPSGEKVEPLPIGTAMFLDTLLADILGGPK